MKISRMVQLAEIRGTRNAFRIFIGIHLRKWPQDKEGNGRIPCNGSQGRQVVMI
jgi:hypothetical protein